MRKGKRIYLPAVVGACVVLLVSGSMVFRVFLGGARIDFTQERLYTLSDGTRELLEGLQEPITVRFFYSAKLVSGFPTLQAYAERLKALLDTYQRLSGGKFRVQIISPEPFSQEEDDAVAFGVEPVPVDQSGTQLYFGLSMNNSTDDNKVFSFMSPEREQFLEYDLTRAVYELAQQKKTKVAVLSGVRFEESAAAAAAAGGAGGGGDWSFMQYLKEEFDVQMLDDKSPSVPKDAGVLMLVRPRLLEEGMIKSINDYLAGGGKVMVFADPMPESEGAEGTDTAVQKLLKDWGIDYDPGLVALDNEHPARSSVSQDIGDGKVRNVVLDRPNWIIASEGMIARDHPAAANLRQLVFKSPGRLVFQPKPGMEWKPLALTGNSSMEVKSDAVSDPEALLRNYKPSGAPLTLAAQLTGVFPGGKAPGTVIVVADVDMLNDSAWLDKQDFMGNEMHMQLADNGAFLLNSLDHLAGSGVLSTLRGRSQVQRPFEAVNALRREAERAFLEKQQELQKKLEDAQSKLTNLREKAKGREAVVSPEEQKEMDSFTKQLLETRVELRKVQHSLNKDIESLGGLLKLLLIGVYPVLVALLGFLLPGRMGVKRGKAS